MTLTTNVDSSLIRRWQNLDKGVDQALAWIEETRLQTPRLALESQALSFNLYRCRIRLKRLAMAIAQEGALGVYGCSQAAKTYLIRTLAADETGSLATRFAGKTLDYLTHIRPGNSATGVALRFSSRVPQQHADYPVQLTLFTEAELVILLAQTGKIPSPVEKQQIDEVIVSLEKRRQRQPVVGINTDEAITIWERCCADEQPAQQVWASEYWPKAIALAPYLAIEDRTLLFSLLWGNDPELTDCYRRLAYRLQQLGTARYVMAPLSLLTDENQQPTQAILSLTSLNAVNDKVQVLAANNSVVSFTLAELNLLTAEVLIPLQMAPSHSGLEQTDLLELPAYRDVHNESLPLTLQRLQQAKSMSLLQRYSDQQAMQALLVCHTAASREEIATVGQALDRWVQQHQEKEAYAHPGLIWVFPPHDRRATVHYDQAVQRYIGEPGENWGTLLAKDDDDTRRMADYLATRVRSDARHHRLIQQFSQLKQYLLEDQLGRWLTPADEDRAQLAKVTVKALQARTTVHGELLEHLLPTHQALQQLYQQQQQLVPSSDPLAIEVDLFSENVEMPLPLDKGTDFAHQVQQLWINQLRSLADNTALLKLLSLEPITLATLADELITASFRLDLWQRLESTLATLDHAANNKEKHIERQIAATLTVLGDFVAWLGFQNLAPALRPESRIQRGHKIFSQSTHTAGSRLTQLPTEPISNSARYIYDWLVGLHTLIAENSGFGSAHALSEAQRKRLGEIVQGMR